MLKFFSEIPVGALLWCVMMPGMLFLRSQNIFSLLRSIQFHKTNQYFSYKDIQRLHASDKKSVIEGYSVTFSSIMRHAFYTQPVLLFCYASASIFYLGEGFSFVAKFLIDKGLLQLNYDPSFATYLSGFGNVSLGAFFVIYWTSGLIMLFFRTKWGQENSAAVFLASAPFFCKNTKL
ncbi:hypothetical protein [Tropicimonas sp. S265A]|uniref:hypothetical protein n=1 Tax=Tropicimonas sp. S265A TaxID=3415134 RepID=UPI003C7CC131